MGNIWSVVNPALFHLMKGSEIAGTAILFEGGRFVTCESFLTFEPQSAQEYLVQDHIVMLSQANNPRNQIQAAVAFRNACDDLAALCCPRIQDTELAEKYLDGLTPTRLVPFAPKSKLFAVSFTSQVVEVQATHRFRSCLTLIVKSGCREPWLEDLQRGAAIVTATGALVAITKVTTLEIPMLEAAIIADALPPWIMRTDAFETLYQVND